MRGPVQQVERTRYPGGKTSQDAVVVEEPLELRVDGEPLAVLMRTPGDDRALAVGFLATEGIIDGADDLRAIAPCGDPNRPNSENILRVTLATGCASPAALESARRTFFATSSCGLCGKATIESILQRVTPHPEALPLSEDFVVAAGERASAAQVHFARTGGLHAAGLFGPGPDYPLLELCEDIGRHNAVDKVVGRALLSDRLPLFGHVLWLSGRAGFEVVQKAVVAGVSGVITVGAPSSLAVALAQDCRLTLVGFAGRRGGFNVYSGAIGDR